MKSELKALLSTIIIMNVSLSFLVFLRTTRTSHDQKELIKDYSETLFRIRL